MFELTVAMPYNEDGHISRTNELEWHASLNNTAVYKLYLPTHTMKYRDYCFCYVCAEKHRSVALVVQQVSNAISKGTV